MSHFIKVCGITNTTDLSFISKANIDAVGFNLYKKSKRHIELVEAKALAEYLPNSFQVFLIFVNQPAQFVSKCLKQIPNAIPQFHGEEDREYCESFGANYVKAIRIRPNTDLEKINQEYKSAKMLIFDSFDEKEYGGTGQTFDLNLLGDSITTPYLVAGGIFGFRQQHRACALETFSKRSPQAFLQRLTALQDTQEVSKPCL